MRALRKLLWIAAAVGAVHGGAACVADSGGDGLNPQPLPPSAPEDPAKGAGGETNGPAGVGDVPNADGGTSSDAGGDASNADADAGDASSDADAEGG